MDKVGVRELRQNLSVYLRRVKDGEELEVTERSRVVARLVPATEKPGSILDEWMARGWSRPARGKLAELGPPPAAGPPAVGDPPGDA